MEVLNMMIIKMAKTLFSSEGERNVVGTGKVIENSSSCQEEQS